MAGKHKFKHNFNSGNIFATELSVVVQYIDYLMQRCKFTCEMATSGF